MSETVHSRQEISTQLERVQADISVLRAMVAQFNPALPPEAVSADWIRGMIHARRRREAIFGSGLFADPAWDMLLELCALKLTNGRISVTDLCKASAVPLTTALRWVGQLERAGLIIRMHDIEDNRRIFVELSRRGSEAMNRYFENPRSSLIAV